MTPNDVRCKQFLSHFLAVLRVYAVLGLLLSAKAAGQFRAHAFQFGPWAPNWHLSPQLALWSLNQHFGAWYQAPWNWLLTSKLTFCCVKWGIFSRVFGASHVWNPTGTYTASAAACPSTPTIPAMLPRPRPPVLSIHKVQSFQLSRNSRYLCRRTVSIPSNQVNYSNILSRAEIEAIG